MSGGWTNGITIEVMARRLTPKQAARVKYQELLFRSTDDSPESRRIDAVIDNDPGHRWFCFCLDAVARMEG